MTSRTCHLRMSRLPSLPSPMNLVATRILLLPAFIKLIQQSHLAAVRQPSAIMRRTIGSTSKAFSAPPRPRPEKMKSRQHSSHPSFEAKPRIDAADAKAEEEKQESDTIEVQKQHHQQAMAQVPADTLTAILSTIDRLSQNVANLSRQVSQMEYNASIHATCTQMQLSRLRHRTKRYAKDNEKLSAELKGFVEKIPQRDEACTTFTCFNKLPPEVRLKIWTFAVSHSEIVPVVTTLKESDISEIDYPLWQLGNFGMRTPQLKSTILQVNQEARREATLRLRRNLGCSKAYFHAMVDTLWLVEASLYISFLDLESCWELADYFISGARSVAVSYDFWLATDSYGRHILGRSNVIEELILIVGDEKGVWRAKPRFVAPAHNPSFYLKKEHPLHGSTWETIATQVLQQINEQRELCDIERSKATEGMETS